jgi:hypothetical protein
LPKKVSQKCVFLPEGQGKTLFFVWTCFKWEQTDFMSKKHNISEQKNNPSRFSQHIFKSNNTCGIFFNAVSRLLRPLHLQQQHWHCSCRLCM